MKKLALHWKILLGMLLGALIGLLMTNFDGGKEIIQDWIKPFGKIFINSLKLIAIPLILAALIKGVSDLKDISKLSKMGGRTIGIYRQCRGSRGWYGHVGWCTRLCRNPRSWFGTYFCGG